MTASYLIESSPEDFTIMQVPAVPTVVVARDCVRQDQLPELYDSTFASLGATAAAGEISITGPAIGLYLRMDDTLDIEIGFPGQISGETAAIASELPAGKVARMVYHGSYDGLPLAWAECVSRIAGEGLQVAGACWEAYVTEPTPELDPADLRTDLYCVVA